MVNYFVFVTGPSIFSLSLFFLEKGNLTLTLDDTINNGQTELFVKQCDDQTIYPCKIEKEEVDKRKATNSKDLFLYDRK
jgi:hypothetical protein